ncbi:hypothetical protein GCM10027046_12270 [Uliginosibacterium flavum]|uniref:Uncharacterized protein n=1 Tax=Uliginosibacterium flavum TaxID=1396831 RepID=A0ABV2TL56_9RHOO
MKASASALLSSTLACLIAIAPAYAQPSGLRLQGHAEGFALRETDSGLRLRFSSETAPVSISAAESSPLTRNTLRADWPVFGYGMHTSLGLSWSAPDAGNTFSNTSVAPSSFMGFGWRSESIRNSGWKLSAELGTNVSGGSGCAGTGAACPPLRPQGLSGDAGGNGLRLTPYINFGATINY